jgi:hypothetical protein
MDGRGLEMITNRKRRIGEDGIPDVRGHPTPVISSGGSMLLEDTVKIATALMSREIFLVVGNTGLFSPLSCFAAPASSRRIHPPAFGRPPFSKGELTYRHPQ